MMAFPTFGNPWSLDFTELFRNSALSIREVDQWASFLLMRTWFSSSGWLKKSECRKRLKFLIPVKSVHMSLSDAQDALQVLWRNMQPIKPGTQMWTPSLGYFYVRYTHNTQDQCLYVPSEGRSLMVKSVLLKNTGVTTGTQPASADQKHQSLDPVLLTARPRHATRIRGSSFFR